MTDSELREILQQHLVSLHTARRQRKEKEALLEQWSRRATLAASEGRADLKQAALSECRHLLDAIERIKADERSMEAEIDTVKAEARADQAQVQRSVDVDILLEQLRGIVGEPDETADALRDVEAQQALEELRRKMRGEE